MNQGLRLHSISKPLIIPLLIILGVVLSPTPLFAAGSDQCQPIYGGGTTCAQNGNLVVDKKVQNPESGSYVDSLGVNDAKYSLGQTISFEILVKNTSKNAVSTIILKDVFPSQDLSFSSGPGTFDVNSKTMTYTISNLNGNEAKTFFVQGKVNNQLGENQDSVCLVNQAMVSQGNQTSQDNAQFCIQNQAYTSLTLPTQSTPTVQNPTTTKGGLPVYKSPYAKKTPPTGPEDLAMFALLPTGALGVWLRRRTSKT